jgi:hypothetical protein
LGYLEYEPARDQMNKAGFHAAGAATLAKEPALSKFRRQLIEKHLTERAAELRAATFSEKEAILRSVLKQVDREVKKRLSYSLF